jgi:DNA repair exonuclease SbcCD nuclease subunit
MLTRRRFLTILPGAWLASQTIPRRLAAGPLETGDETAIPPAIGASQRVADPARQPAVELVPASSFYCKILQFTDLHLQQKTEELDAATFSDCRQQLARHRPDLVVVTGDAWQSNLEGAGRRGLELFIKNASGWGVPWAFCWGNHDQLDDYQRGHDLLESAPHSLYRGGQAHGHYRIEIRTARQDGSLAARCDLFLLNSGATGLGAFSLGWLRSATSRLQATRPGPLPAFAFFHLPLPDYESRIAGANFRGLKLSHVDPLQTHPQAYATLAASQTIRAGYCGHCHVNDYTLKTNGPELVMSRATGRASFGEEYAAKGAKLIEIELATGQFQHRTVFPNGSEWLV